MASSKIKGITIEIGDTTKLGNNLHETGSNISNAVSKLSGKNNKNYTRIFFILKSRNSKDAKKMLTKKIKCVIFYSSEST